MEQFQAPFQVGMLVRCLHSDDATVSRNAAFRLKDMLVVSNPDQRSNQDLIAGVDGAVDGLVNILQRGSPDGKYYACYCLAQLAWSNERNSLLIPSTPGALDSIAVVLSQTLPPNEHRGAREYAAITLGNCGANSEEGAQIIVRHTRIVSALVMCLRDEQDVRMQETTVVALKNCAASSQEAAFLIANIDPALELIKKLALQDVHSRISDVAMGAINSISRSPRAVPLLVQKGFRKEVLSNLLLSTDYEAAAELKKLTVACAVVNIEASDPQKPSLLQPWIVSKDGRRAVSNMVKCLGFALQGQQWNSVSFSPHSVVCPLFNLTRCFSSSDLCLDEAKVVTYITQLIRDSQRFSHWTDNMQVAMKFLENLSHNQDWQRLMRGLCMPLLQAVVSTNSPDSVWFPPHPSPEDQVAMRRIKSQAEKLVKSLLHFPVAVCMGQHPRLGRNSLFMHLDDALLQMIAIMALYE